MAPPITRQDKADNLRETLTILAAYDPKAMSRPDHFGKTHNFKEVVPEFEAMIATARLLAARDVSQLPLSHIDAVGAACIELSAVINAVKSFDPHSNDASIKYSEIINRIKSTREQMLEACFVPSALSLEQVSKVLALEGDIVKVLTSVRAHHATAESEVSNLLSEVGKARQAIRKQMSETAADAHAVVFDATAKSAQASATIWLSVAVAVALLTLCVAVKFLVSVEDQARAMSAGQTSVVNAEPVGGERVQGSLRTDIQLVVSKLVLLSLLTYITVWCSRNYRAHRHNQVANMHRSNALQTFQTFIAGTAEDRTKDAILLYAAQAVFGSRPTGYDPNESDSPQVVPVIDALTRTAARTPAS